jgi:hypothetical protein
VEHRRRTLTALLVSRGAESGRRRCSTNSEVTPPNVSIGAPGTAEQE